MEDLSDYRNVIFTKDHKDAPENCGPESLYLFPQKIVEKILLEVIFGHMMEKKVTENKQHGFTKGKSCFTNLIAAGKERAKWIKINRVTTWENYSWFKVLIV